MTVSLYGNAQAIGIRETEFEGRFRPISTHQLCLAWWCHLAGHITRRQLRVWFAAHEMHERRRYMAQEGPGAARKGGKDRKPLYGLDELKALVGGRGSPTADAELAGDLRRLAKIGLLVIEPHVIRFAVSADQILLDDMAGFWTMFDQVPNRGRVVPVPRRTLRALAGGFSRAVTGVMIALMIRSLFWHRESQDYRVDGRTKGSWIADVFGLSRRAVTDARARLIEIGWLEAIEVSQWEMNRWGSRDRIHVEWKPAAETPIDAAGEGSEPAAASGDFASPAAENQGEIASPCLNSSSFPSERISKPENSDPRSDPAGLSADHFSSRRKSQIGEGAIGKKEGVSLRNIQTPHLLHTPSLMVLLYQAVADGLIADSEKGRLDFFALAARATSRGKNPGALFRWLLVNKRFEFITMADEDAAVERLRATRQGAREDRPRQSRAVRPPLPPETDTDRLVRACLGVAEKRGIGDPFIVLKQVKPEWTREQWDAAVDAAEGARLARLNHYRTDDE